MKMWEMLERLVHRELAKSGRARIEMVYAVAVSSAPHYGLTRKEGKRLAKRLVEMYKSIDIFTVEEEGEIAGIAIGEIRYSS